MRGRQFFGFRRPSRDRNGLGGRYLGGGFLNSQMQDALVIMGGDRIRRRFERQADCAVERAETALGHMPIFLLEVGGQAVLGRQL